MCHGARHAAWGWLCPACDTGMERQVEHCQLPHCREGFFLTVCQNQDACQQTLDPTSPGICPRPEREAWEVGCLSEPPGACWTAPDHAFHPSRADLWGISGL